MRSNDFSADQIDKLLRAIGKRQMYLKQLRRRARQKLENGDSLLPLIDLACDAVDVLFDHV